MRTAKAILLVGASIDMEIDIEEVRYEGLAIRRFSVLGPGGRLVTIVSTVKSAEDDRTKQALFFVEPNRKQWCDIAALLEAGQVRPVIGATVPFALAAVVYAREPVRNGRPGKTVVTLIPPT